MSRERTPPDDRTCCYLPAACRDELGHRGSPIDLAANQPANLRRRTVLGFAVAAPGFAAASALFPAESVSAALHRLFGGNASLREFGRIFHARQADAASRMLARLNGLAGSAVSLRVDALRKEDFAAGRVVVIKGWVLARAEAEACAFIATS